MHDVDHFLALMASPVDWRTESLPVSDAIAT